MFKLEKCGKYSVFSNFHKISVSDVDAEEIEARLWPDNSSK